MVKELQLLKLLYKTLMVQRKQKYKNKFKMVLITLFKNNLDQELLNKTKIEDKLEIENEFTSN